MTKPRQGRQAAAVAGLAALLVAGPAGAASQGALSSTSRGSITITVSLRAPARVTGLADVALDRAVPTQELCFEGAARGFTVNAAGGGPDGTLSVSNGDERVAYRVEWLQRSNASPATMADCVPGSSRLRIALDPAAAERLGSGAPYTGALVLTVVPQ